LTAPLEITTGVLTSVRLTDPHSIGGDASLTDPIANLARTAVTVFKAGHTAHAIETKLGLVTIQVALAAPTAAIQAKSPPWTIGSTVALHIADQTLLVTDIGNFAFGIDTAAWPASPGLTDHGTFCAIFIAICISIALGSTAVISAGQPILTTLGITPAVPLNADRLHTKLIGFTLRILSTGYRQDHLTCVAGPCVVLTDPFEATVRPGAFSVRQTGCAHLGRTTH